MLVSMCILNYMYYADQIALGQQIRAIRADMVVIRDFLARQEARLTAIDARLESMERIMELNKHGNLTQREGLIS